MSFNVSKTNEQSTIEEKLMAYYIDNPNVFIVIANVLVSPFHMYQHQLSLDGWNVIPTLQGTKYYREFNYNSTPEEWLNSIDSLNRFLLSYFINDFSPRKIHSFELPSYIKEDILVNLNTIFGNSTKSPSIEEMAKLSYYMSGTIFNSKNDMPPYQVDNSLINEWYGIFENELIYSTVKLIQEAFILINKHNNQFNYYNHMELSMGIIILVSALENLFTYNQDKHTDIKFKFSLIGSLYYERNVTDDFLRKMDFCTGKIKFNQSDFRKLLSLLYDLRSDIAHGSNKEIFKGKNWKKLFLLLKVQDLSSANIAIIMKNVAFTLGLLQKHIFALIIQSKDDLINKADIIDQIIIQKNL